MPVPASRGRADHPLKGIIAPNRGCVRTGVLRHCGRGDGRPPGGRGITDRRKERRLAAGHGRSPRNFPLLCVPTGPVTRALPVLFNRTWAIIAGMRPAPPPKCNARPLPASGLGEDHVSGARNSLTVRGGGHDIRPGPGKKNAQGVSIDLRPPGKRARRPRRRRASILRGVGSAEGRGKFDPRPPPALHRLFVPACADGQPHRTVTAETRRSRHGRQRDHAEMQPVRACAGDESGKGLEPRQRIRSGIQYREFTAMPSSMPPVSIAQNGLSRPRQGRAHRRRRGAHRSAGAGEQRQNRAQLHTQGRPARRRPSHQWGLAR